MGVKKLALLEEEEVVKKKSPLAAGDKRARSREFYGD